MKRVWILNHYAVEPTGFSGTRHFSLAEGLLAHGWEASIIAASVEHETGRQRLSPGELRRKEIYRQIPFLWIRTPQHEGNGLSRILGMLSYSFRALMPGYTRELAKPDVIIGSSVHPFAAVAGALLARRHRVPFIFEVRDLWPQTLIDVGWLKEKSLATRLFQKMELWLYRRASRIVVLLPGAAEYIARLGIPVGKVVWIPNGVDFSGFPVPPQPVRKEGDPFVLMYFGAHGHCNGLENVLRAMKVVSQRAPEANIRLRMIGQGPLKPDLMKLAETLGLKNVSFEAPVPKSVIPEVAAAADAFVFNLVNAPVFRYGISSNKLFDFLAGARPVIFCCDAGNNPVEEAKAGVTVPPEDPDALAEAILNLAGTPAAERIAMGRRAREYVEKHHAYPKLAGRLAATLDEVMGDKVDVPTKRLSRSAPHSAGSTTEVGD